MVTGKLLALWVFPLTTGGETYESNRTDQSEELARAFPAL
jgi:hypothetical protein